ncbi:MAG: class I SAM-dependent methyltransferase [Proteobacteria bacterium]|jgi:hypothetical protein|nr:class I SAM-dependent methyltransferase [Pseudomonadota bacterium]
MHTRTELLNSLIQKNNYQTYLEIGTASGWNFNAIVINYKEGVDPTPTSECNPTHNMTSDEFFAQNDKKFDIIFIDGLHVAEQVDKDVENSLYVLNPGGIIILHDCNPLEEFWQTPTQQHTIWTGTVWKSLVKLRTRTNLLVGVINIDFGCGFVKQGKQKPVELHTDLTYALLETNRQEWLNLMSPEEFYSLIEPTAK